MPLLVVNNRPGADAKILRQFGEPAWNYQVVRFLTAKGKDLIPRKDKVWTTGPLARRMIASLKVAKRPVPSYLQALADATLSDSRKAQVALAMHCFWTGEMRLGQLNGVLETEAGFLGGHEVTLVTYDPSRLALKSLVRKASALGCAQQVYLENGSTEVKGAKKAHFKKDYRKARASDQRRQLQGTAFAKLDLNATQATKVNAWCRVDPAKALAWLSPKQRAQVQR